MTRKPGADTYFSKPALVQRPMGCILYSGLLILTVSPGGTIVVGKGLLTVAILAITAIVIAIFLPDLVVLTEGVRTEVAQETGLTCTTGVGETSCNFTLAAEHEYPDTSQMTVTETAPGSAEHTANTTVSSDRLTLTVSSLSAATAYTFTVDYMGQATGVSDTLNGVLRVFPVLLALGGVGVVVAGFARMIGVF